MDHIEDIFNSINMPEIFIGTLELCLKGLTTPKEFEELIIRSTQCFRDNNPTYQMTIHVASSWEGKDYHIVVTAAYLNMEGVLQMNIIHTTNKLKSKGGK